MNRRQARRLATTRLATTARQLAGDDFDELPRADADRVRRAFADLAHELAIRAGLEPRTALPPLVDPGQGHLFDVEEDPHAQQDRQ